MSTVSPLEMVSCFTESGVKSVFPPVNLSFSPSQGSSVHLVFKIGFRMVPAVIISIKTGPGKRGQGVRNTARDMELSWP